MKKAILLFVALVIVAVVVLVLSRGSKTAVPAPPPKTIVRIYFSGADNLAADTNSTAFTNIFCSAQAQALARQTLDKLSRAPGAWFKDKLPPGTPDGSAQLRPLLDDFLKSKWVFEMGDATSSPEYTLAIQLSGNRAQLWQTNLRTLLETWTGITATNVTGGWELKKDMPPNLFRVVRSTNWLVIGCGQDELPLSDAWTSGAESPDTNETNWASAKVDWPRLAQIFPVFAKFDLPAVQIQVVGRNGFLLPSGTLELAQPLPPLPDWQIPTNLIHQPLTSFTAVRGFAPWLERQPWAKWLPLSPEPDQLFVWSIGLSPLQTFAAVPVTNGVTALGQLGQNLAADESWERYLLAPFTLVRTNDRIFLLSVPFSAPEVRALKEPSGDFLFADIFPNTLRGNAPQLLIQEVNRDNLVAYHWEATSERLKEMPELVQLALLLTRHRQLDPNAPAGQWLNHIGPLLSNSATEVTQIGPSELAFRRSAPAGLTAIELMALSEWLESPNFPDCDLSPPPRHFFPKHRPQIKMQHPQNTHQPPQPPVNGHQVPATNRQPSSVSH